MPQSPKKYTIPRRAKQCNDCWPLFFSPELFPLVALLGKSVYPAAALFSLQRDRNDSNVLKLG